MKGNETRESIVRIGTEVIGQGGFNATGIDSVLKRAKVPKGSFYYYFASKDDFGLAVIDQAATEFSQKIDSFLKDEQYPPLQRIRNWLENSLASVSNSQCKKGCLIGTLGQELAAQNEKFRKRIDEVFQSWQGQIAVCLQEAKDSGELSKNANCTQLAEFLMIGWEGAILRSKVKRSVGPIQSFVTTLFEKVLK